MTLSIICQQFISPLIFAERVVFGLMIERMSLIVAGSVNPTGALAETMDFWEGQIAGVEAGAVVVLREPGPGGWLRIKPQADVADLLVKGFTVVEV